MYLTKLTNIQAMNIKKVLDEHWGCNIQTGFTQDGTPYMYIKKGPNIPALGYEFPRDGQIEIEKIGWDGKSPPVMLKVAGKPFHCECGANVLTKIGEDLYECNGCRTQYNGS